jgi:hypothetical protein
MFNFPWQKIDIFFYLCRYALEHVLESRMEIEHSDHGMMRRFFFHLSLIFARINMWLTYISLGLNLMSVKLTLDLQCSHLYLYSYPKLNLAGMLFTIYLMNLMTIVFVCIQATSRTLGEGQFMRKLLKFSTHFMGILSFGAYALMGYLLLRDNKIFAFNDMMILCVYVTFSLQVLLVLLNSLLLWNKDFIQSFLALPFYLYFSPTYINTFMIFSFCNLDDFSWGTKGNYDTENKVSLNLLFFF